jgi:hypothetical protein
MSAIGHHLRGLFTRRSIATEPTVIVWWGSGPRGATIGDLLAVRNLSAGLSKRGHAHSIISHPRFAESGHVVADDLARLRAGIETIVFACGPLVRTGRLWFLLGRYPRARKFAVGVSVLPHEAALNRRFTGFVARDGMTPAHFDLSIDAVEPPAPPPTGRPVRAGLCFRGPQKEYRGRDCLADRAEAMLTGAARRCGLEPVPFTTVLGGNRAAADVQESFRSVDVVLTTRLHGSLLALAAGKPVIAIDQIAGGAKLLPVLARTGWRHALPVDAADEERTTAILRGFLDAWPADEIVAAQNRACALSRAAVEASVALVTGGP